MTGDNITIFSPVPENVIHKYYNVGYNYLDHNYINVFRWLWDDAYIHPHITSFPGDPENKTRVAVASGLMDDTAVNYCIGYDEAVIWVVDYISKNIDKYFDDINPPEQYY